MKSYSFPRVGGSKKGWAEVKEKTKDKLWDYGVSIGAVALMIWGLSDSVAGRNVLVFGGLGLLASFVRSRSPERSLRHDLAGLVSLVCFTLVAVIFIFAPQH